MTLHRLRKLLQLFPKGHAERRKPPVPLSQGPCLHFSVHLRRSVKVLLKFLDTSLSSVGKNTGNREAANTAPLLHGQELYYQSAAHPQYSSLRSLSVSWEKLTSSHKVQQSTVRSTASCSPQPCTNPTSGRCVHGHQTSPWPGWLQGSKSEHRPQLQHRHLPQRSQILGGPK